MASFIGRNRPVDRFTPLDPQNASEAKYRLPIRTRMRRNRKAEWSRRLVQENVLTVNDLIWPVFVVEGASGRQPVTSMPGVDRLTVGEAVREAERAASLNIPAIALFPYIDPALRDPTGSESLNGRNLICRTVREIKKAVPNIGIICDVALDPYTSHGHDGVMDGDRILNDETVALLVRQALLQAEAGADIIFIEAPTTVEQLRLIPQKFTIPVMANGSTSGASTLRESSRGVSSRS